MKWAAAAFARRRARRSAACAPRRASDAPSPASRSSRRRARRSRSCRCCASGTAAAAGVPLACSGGRLSGAAPALRLSRQGSRACRVRESAGSRCPPRLIIGTYQRHGDHQGQAQEREADSNQRHGGGQRHYPPPSALPWAATRKPRADGCSREGRKSPGRPAAPPRAIMLAALGVAAAAPSSRRAALRVVMARGGGETGVQDEGCRAHRAPPFVLRAPQRRSAAWRTCEGDLPFT